MSYIRGIRGAISVPKNTKDEIVSSTMTLLRKMAGLNKIKAQDIASVVFSMTKDLNAEFPAIAARKLGWKNTPLLCTYEVDVPGSLPRCIRVIMHVNSGKDQSAIKHVYLKDAKKLRPDLG
ncbi:MAG: chorismate mutase [bacterium]